MGDEHRDSAHRDSAHRDSAHRDSALGETAGEEAVQPEGTEEDSAAPPTKPDLSVSSHQDLGVKVSRDLNATGWLARGDRSNMSKLSFSVRAKPRDELDPELQALREPVKSAAKPESNAEPPAPAAPAQPAAAPAAPPDTVARDDGVLGRLGRLFRSE